MDIGGSLDIEGDLDILSDITVSGEFNVGSGAQFDSLTLLNGLYLTQNDSSAGALDINNTGTGPSIRVRGTGGNSTPTDLGALSATTLASFFAVDSGTTYGSAVAGSVVKETADNAGGSSLTLSDIADAVWDEAIAGHTTSGTTGEALDDASSGGGGGASAAAIWSYADRTLSQNSASVTATLEGNVVSVYRGATWTIEFTGLDRRQ